MKFSKLKVLAAAFTVTVAMLGGQVSAGETERNAVKKEDASDLKYGENPGVEFVGESSENKAWLYKFTPENSGFYSIVFDMADDCVMNPVIAFYDENFDPIYTLTLSAEGSYTQRFYLKANTPLYILDTCYPNLSKGKCCYYTKVTDYKSSKAGWNDYKDKWYYIENGEYVTGWKNINGVKYHFGNFGEMSSKSWLMEVNCMYYFAENGLYVTGWQYMSLPDFQTGESFDCWLYFGEDGKMCTAGWNKINGKWYYFDKNGSWSTMATGWKKVGNTWYYLKSSGEMTTGWIQINGVWYFLESSGAMATGWKELGGTWYFFESGGNMVTGNKTIGGVNYNFDSNGHCTNPYG